MSVEVRLDGLDTAISLRPARTALLRGSGTLFVSDLHLAKGAHFRSEGLPVPEGGTTETLRRLTDDIADSRCKEVVILGDLFHSRLAFIDGGGEVFARWRSEVGVDVAIVPGNHDQGIDMSRLDVTVMLPGDELHGIRLFHDPGPGAAILRNGRQPSLAGHIHPAVRLREGRSGLRLPCFLVGSRFLLMPAFGEFTGTGVVRPRQGERVFVCTDDLLVEPKLVG